MQQTRDTTAAKPFGKLKSRAAQSAMSFNCSVMSEQHLRNLDMIMARGNVQRSAATHVIRSVHIRLRLEQELHYLFVAVEGCDVKTLGALSVGGAYTRTILQERFDA